MEQFFFPQNALFSEFLEILSNLAACHILKVRLTAMDKLNFFLISQGVSLMYFIFDV